MIEALVIFTPLVILLAGFAYYVDRVKKGR